MTLMLVKARMQFTKGWQNRPAPHHRRLNLNDQLGRVWFRASGKKGSRKHFLCGQMMNVTNVPA